MSKTIWTYLLKEIKNEFGVAGLMGNLYAESGLCSNNLENSYERKFGMTDAEYVKAVDSGEYTCEMFSEDHGGFGYAQWTFHTRKAALYKYAKSAGVSIADEKMQLEFLVKELKSDFKSVWNTLCNAQSVREASDIVLLKFEQPKDQSKKVQEQRASYGQKYYDEYASDAKTYITYEIKYGDTLSKIACKHNVTVDEIVDLNGIVNPNFIRTGDEIKIPTKSKVEFVSYTVKKGDSLSKIGATFGVSWKKIAEYNGITSPYTIYPNQKIKIPKG